MTRLTPAGGRHYALAFMTLALLVAAVLRLPQLTEIPPGVHYDEAAYGLNAGDIGLRGDRPIFIPSFTGREPLFSTPPEGWPRRWATPSSPCA